MGLPCGGGGGGEALFGSAWSCTSSRKLNPKPKPAARKRTSGGGLFGHDDGDYIYPLPHHCLMHPSTQQPRTHCLMNCTIELHNRPNQKVGKAKAAPQHPDRLHPLACSAAAAAAAAAVAACSAAVELMALPVEVYSGLHRPRRRGSRKPAAGASGAQTTSGGGLFGHDDGNSNSNLGSSIPRWKGSRLFGRMAQEQNIEHRTSNIGYCRVLVLCALCCCFFVVVVGRSLVHCAA